MIGNWTSDRVQLSDRCTPGKELQGDPCYEALFQTGEHSVLGRRIENTKAERRCDQAQEEMSYNARDYKRSRSSCIEDVHHNPKSRGFSIWSEGQ
jgi:hypothetical protein